MTVSNSLSNQRSKDYFSYQKSLLNLFIFLNGAYLRDSAILMYSGALSSTFSMHILSLWQEDKFWESEQQETPKDKTLNDGKDTTV